ncbi:malate dehydrogenase, putative [Perkinsus marinus ATCC 50983]|uniref:malate dehydrogenase n=1 Tax=Perkinsus marinus (strain ATCC 50983 / TXsc) TaxID=423536 RepID=C5KR73_PERM5|nr:malate dehydrogenase, putative [Perkinsus marinus ATCC 50983]EER12974.1 malate dehydrogenase, putative [Perkinsus marinus ATCC 50983]|eukprot:XP_002781179.1 malate dehydrogenase, putative [Perkinsus marinus ATCC 50983]
MSSFKVALLGACGGIGQPLALLLKLNQKISELALYDIKQARTPCAGVAEDLSHINTPAEVKGYAGEEELEACLTGSKLIVITAGVPRKPGMTRDDLFSVNAGIAAGLAKNCAKYAPDATLCIVTNPVNSIVPACAEVYKQAGVFNPKKLLGVSLLDTIRAETFVAKELKTDVNKVTIPVIGGHAGVTIMPWFSHATPKVDFDEATLTALDNHVQGAGTDVVNAKAGAGSATLAMAYAAAEFVEVVIRGMHGEQASASTFFNEPYGDVQYFSYLCDFGPEGVSKTHPIEGLSEHEAGRLQEVITKLKVDVQRGIDFANKQE